MKKVIHVELNYNAPPGFPLVALITLAATVSVSSKEITKGLAGLANEDHPRSHPMPMTWMVPTIFLTVYAAKFGPAGCNRCWRGCI